MAEKRKPEDKGDNGESTIEQYLVKDPERFALNFARMIEEAGKAASAWAKPRESGEVRDTVAEPMADMVKTFSKLTEYWLSDPSRALEAQTRLFSGYMSIWANSVRKLSGEEVSDAVEADRGDKRFQDPEWGKNAFFDFLKQVYLVTSRWAADLVENTEGLDEHTRHKARFYMKQITNALSPSNFVLTNPELFRETIASHGENLTRGMKMLAEDIRAGKGDLKLRQSDHSRFKVGENLATTPGKVVARNHLVEIIQYAPSTEKVLKRPLLICPPWINKFYILDLNPEKSFIRWAVEQGHTVFVISWVNPDERHGRLDWEAYIHDGLVFGLDTIEVATGAREVNAVGYCVGGTLLAAALALLAQTGDDRIRTVTFLTTQVDFTHAGDLKVFVDEEQLAGRLVSLADVKIPVYNLAAREDHIAPALSVFVGSKLFGGEVEYVLAGSGHIAGVVNPPALKKYQHWTGGKPVGAFDAWLAKAKENPGSWWTHWQKWIERHDRARVPARVPGEKTPVLGDAPGEYVKVRV